MGRMGREETFLKDGETAEDLMWSASLVLKPGGCQEALIRKHYGQSCGVFWVPFKLSSVSNDSRS